MKTLRNVLFISTILFSGGCITSIHIVNSIDASIERKVQPDSGHYVVTLCYENQKPIEKVLRFERYYDAQCSVRGNYWAWRQVGKQTDYQSDNSIEIKDKKLGVIQFPIPNAETLKTEKWPTQPLRTLLVNRISYFYVTSKGGKHIYKAESIHPSLRELYKYDENISLTYSFEIKFKAD